MTVLRPLFLYRERGYSQLDESLPSIHDNMYFLSEELADGILNYMKRGVVILEFVSPVPDPLGGGDMVRNVILSDGIYAWDGIIMNWIDRCRVKLPGEFVRHYEAVKDRDLPVSEQDAERLFDEFRSAPRVYV
ncbi:hypothetical protein [Stenotrophomonas pigmentata]|uniref:hypothetical protein n=1 Tax=Stenotrophomonas pigmentata TaxID=3055080 RepID=UPI0026EC5478|nr:hypothetical protein [Stenotrophomonas sp. 610A2]